MVASINYLYSQITKESSHIISLYNRVKSGAEGVKGYPLHLSHFLKVRRIFYLVFDCSEGRFYKWESFLNSPNIEIEKI